MPGEGAYTTTTPLVARILPVNSAALRAMTLCSSYISRTSGRCWNSNFAISAGGRPVARPIVALMMCSLA